MDMSNRIPKREFIEYVTQIFTHKRDDLINIAVSILKVHEDADDAVSNAFMLLMKHSQKRYFYFKGNLRGYVAKCVKNEALKLYNKRKKRTEVEEVPEWKDIEAQTPHFLAEGRITMDMIESKLELVRPPAHAVVWKEHHIFGKSQQLIQEELWLTEYQVRDWIASANKQMKILLADYLEELSDES